MEGGSAQLMTDTSYCILNDMDGTKLPVQWPANKTLGPEYYKVASKAGTPDERMASRSNRGLRGQDLLRFSNGAIDYGAQSRVNTYANYRKTMSEQPEFEMWFINAVLWTSGAGELYEGGAALYSLGRMGLRKVLARGVMAEVRALGIAGEEAAGITGSKVAIKVGSRTRIPDKLTELTIEEVKNVKYQSLTSQLKDFYQYSQDNGLKLVLHVRPANGTTLSKPLQALVDNGSILLKKLEGL